MGVGVSDRWGGVRIGRGVCVHACVQKGGGQGGWRLCIHGEWMNGRVGGLVQW